MRSVVVMLTLIGCGRVHFDEHSTNGRGSDSDAGDTATVDAATQDAGPCTAIGCTGTVRISSCSGRCFSSCRESISQAAAATQCQAWGGQLASIRNQAEQDCVRQLAVQQGNSWIGYVQSGGATPSDGWTWTDGSPMTFVNWGASEPDDIDMTESGEEDCAQIFGSTGEWVDWDCPGTVPSFACVR